MPLRQVGEYGGECPLGKWRIDIPAGAGGYTADPVEACLHCNFAYINGSDEKFDPDKICQCPPDMTWDRYELLKSTYSIATPTKERSRRGFWEFVNSNPSL